MSSSIHRVVVLSAALFLLALSAQQQHAEGAYTYQKLNELMPELRQFLGRTHLGTLRPLTGQQRGSFPSFLDDDQIQASKRTIRATFRERKSNNLRNLMRIGKRRMPTAAGFAGAAGGDDSANGAGAGAVYYFSPSFPNDNQFQAKQIRLPFRLSSFLKI